MHIMHMHADVWVLSYELVVQTFSHTIRRIVNEGTLSPPRRAGPPSDVITTI